MGKNDEKKLSDNKRDITKNKKKDEGVENEITIENKEETEKTEESKIGENKNKKIYIGIVCICVIIGVMFFTAKGYDDLVYPSINLYDEDISKLDSDQLKNKVNDTVNFIKKNTITINIEDKKYDITVGDLISDFNEDKTAHEVMSFGKDSNFLQQFGLITLNVNRNYDFSMKINEDALEEKVDEIYKDSEVAVVEPTITIKNEKINVSEGKNGRGINKEKLKQDILSAIESNEIGKTNIVLNEEYKTLKPSINSEDLKEVDTKISSYTTYFAGTGNNRGLNISNAASLINNTLLMPGDEFNYEKAVNPITLDNGYYMAPVIINGTHGMAPGGGVCQVSSTLYNAQLKAGILPTERYNHSKSVSYVKKGLDATLATGSKNLRFKNPYDYPILIHAYTVGGQLTVEFWSKDGVLDGKEYTPVSFVKGNVANAYLYEYNNKGELIDKIFIDTSIYR